MKRRWAILLVAGVVVASLLLTTAIGGRSSGVTHSATPTATPSPTPTPKVFKVVPVKFCILREDRNNDDKDDKDDGRFNQDKWEAGLVEKSLIFAQCPNPIIFKPEGFIAVDDPNPPSPTPAPTPTPPGTPTPEPAPPDGGWGPGKKGDVREPAAPTPDAQQDREWNKVKEVCDQAMHPWERKNKLVEILIRSLVNENGVKTAHAGVSEWDTCRTERLEAKPMTNDPDLTADFGQTLAHENGHALGLPHSEDPEGLMYGEDNRGKKLTAAECQTAWDHAEKVPAHYKKDEKGNRVEEEKPATREVVDPMWPVGPVPRVWYDIMDANAVATAEDTLALDMGLAGLVPDDIAGLDYVFMVDVDKDTDTGGSPPVPFQHTFQGADLFAEIAVAKTGGVPSVTSVVKRYVGAPEQWVEVIDPRIEADLVTVWMSFVGGGSSRPAQDIVAFELPEDLLPTPLVEGYRVGSFAFDSLSHGLDEAPILEGSITEFFDPTSITIDPVIGAGGDTVTVSGDHFNRDSTVDIYLGELVVASAPTDGNGSFATHFTVPPPSAETFTYNAGWGTYVSPIMGVDRITVQIDDQIEKISDVALFQLALPPGGTVEFGASGPDVSARPDGGSGRPVPYAPLAGGAAAAAALALAAGGWYARRRFRQRRIRP